ncbi:uncharacterized protein BXZ73DRAFT_75008 [Epithele typhae]|uniref:uncharacterized protein n=1 Tax=Epithele typhae TaxID=378194 RepID=UPI0020085045|nr:uncharacterized protein BXZ73DRAFT_75008 [Epithele typhae]KAH9941829.1 hypothetical protein BXZ73DRAFT_75008 [Epithele typhae]
MFAFAIAGLLIFVPHGSAQSTNAKCDPQYAWMNNAKGQSPCLVTSWLRTTCYTAADSSIPALSPNGTNTGKLSIDPFPNPIPPHTSVPAWAYGDVVTSSNFNVAQAEAVANSNAPDSSAKAGMTVTSGTAVIDPNPTSRSPASVTDSGSDPTGTGSGDKNQEATSSKSSNVGAIVGGIVGGLAGAALLAGAGYWFIFRHRRNGASPSGPGEAEKYGEQRSQDGRDAAADNGRHSFAWTAAKLPEAAPLIYDPDDPRTFPPPISTDVSATFGPGVSGIGHNPAEFSVPEAQSTYHSRPEL